jgi:hypothetical protein
VLFEFTIEVLKWLKSADYSGKKRSLQILIY